MDAAKLAAVTLVRTWRGRTWHIVDRDNKALCEFGADAPFEWAHTFEAQPYTFHLFGYRVCAECRARLARIAERPT